MARLIRFAKNAWVNPAEVSFLMQHRYSQDSGTIEVGLKAGRSLCIYFDQKNIKDMETVTTEFMLDLEGRDDVFPDVVCPREKEYARSVAWTDPAYKKLL